MFKYEYINIECNTCKKQTHDPFYISERLFSTGEERRRCVHAEANDV